MIEEVEKLLRKLDRELLPRGFHNNADSALFFVGRAASGNLFTQRAQIPSLDHHPNLVATELLYEIAVQARAADRLPISEARTVGMAWTMEAHQASIPKDAPSYVENAFNQSRLARELDRWDGAVEVRVISVAMCCGCEGGLIRHTNGEVWRTLGPQMGLVYRSLRVLCGRPEDDPDPRSAPPKFERVSG